MFTFFCSPVFCSKKKKIRKNRSWHKCLKGVCSESASTVTNIDFYAWLCTLKCLFPPAGLPLCIALHSKTPPSRGRGGGERKKQSCGALGVFSCCGVGGAAQEGTTDSVWAEMVRAESPNPQDMEWWKSFSAAVGVITFRRSHEGNSFLSEAAAVCSFSFWSKYFCTRQAESYRSGSGHDGGYKCGMNFRWVRKWFGHLLSGKMWSEDRTEKSWYLSSIVGAGQGRCGSGPAL